MFSPSHSHSSHLKTLNSPLQALSILKSPSSTSLSSTKLKSLIHTLIISRMCRIIRALSKLKALILQIFKDNHHACHRKHYYNNKNRNNKNIILGSFRLHYNWCSSKSSSHVLPVPSPVYQVLPSSISSPPNNINTHDDDLYYDQYSSWNVPTRDNHDHDHHDDSHLAGYLQWLEEKVEGKHEINEIDLLAEMFIANCHEKFKLEKQESDRRFQEMLARSM